MWFAIQKLGFDKVYVCAKFDDSSLSRSRDITGDLKFIVGHVTLTTPLLTLSLPDRKI